MSSVLEQESIKIEFLFDFLNEHNIRIVYCPNEELGLSGPFVELTNKDQLEYAIAYNSIQKKETPNFQQEQLVSLRSA